MKIDFDAPINTIKGIQLTQEEPDPDNPKKMITQHMTLRDYVADALLRNEQGLAVKASMTRYVLAKRIQDSNGAEEVSIKEAALIQKQLTKAFAPLVAGQAILLIEGDTPKE